MSSSSLTSKSLQILYAIHSDPLLSSKFLPVHHILECNLGLGCLRVSLGHPNARKATTLYSPIPVGIFKIFLNLLGIPRTGHRSMNPAGPQSKGMGLQEHILNGCAKVIGNINASLPQSPDHGDDHRRHLAKFRHFTGVHKPQYFCPLDRVCDLAQTSVAVH